ncbi:MAG: Holliday junction branch migration protein RuvA [Elusimicrobiota bacterium]
MIAYLKGNLISKNENMIIVDVNGIGYEITPNQTILNNLPQIGEELRLFISESTNMYGGTTLYGFANKEEKEIFELFKEAVPNTGAKKALEYLNKVLKSLPDFQRGIVKNDLKLLTSIFGFTTKTAEKLATALKYKMPEFAISGETKIKVLEDFQDKYSHVLNALYSLGYKPSESKSVLESIQIEGISDTEKMEDILKRALRKLST